MTIPSPSSLPEIQLEVEGMTCAHCAQSITRVLEKKGLQDVNVDFVTNEVRFKAQTGGDLSGIIKGIEDLGYKVITRREEKKKSSGLSPVELKFLFTLPFTVIL